MDDIFRQDHQVDGAKGLVFIGDKIIVYRRDTHTAVHPLELDLPGGGGEEGECPFDTFKREVREEFGLELTPRDIVYARRYPSTIKPGRFGYYLVAKLPPKAQKQITFGNEGVGYLLLTPEEYVVRNDAWSLFQARTVDYLQSFRR